MSSLAIYILTGAAVIFIWLLGLAMCVDSARRERAFDAAAQERKARAGLRAERNVISLPQRRRDETHNGGGFR